MKKYYYYQVDYCIPQKQVRYCQPNRTGRTLKPANITVKSNWISTRNWYNVCLAIF